MSELNALILQLSRAAKKTDVQNALEASETKGIESGRAEAWLSIITNLDYRYATLTGKFILQIKRMGPVSPNLSGIAVTVPQEYINIMTAQMNVFNNLTQTRYPVALRQLNQLYAALREKDGVSMQTLKHWQELFERYQLDAEQALQKLQKNTEDLRQILTKSILKTFVQPEEVSESDSDSDVEILLAPSVILPPVITQSPIVTPGPAVILSPVPKPVVIPAPGPTIITPPSPVVTPLPATNPAPKLIITPTDAPNPSPIVLKSTGVSSQYLLANAIHKCLLPYTYYTFPYASRPKNDTGAVLPNQYNMLGVAFLPSNIKDSQVIPPKRIDEIFDNIKNTPGFQQLMKGYQNVRLAKTGKKSTIRRIWDEITIGSSIGLYFELQHTKTEFDHLNQALNAELVDGINKIAPKADSTKITSSPTLTEEASQSDQSYLGAHVFFTFFDRLTGRWTNNSNITFSIFENDALPSDLGTITRWKAGDFVKYDPTVDNMVETRTFVSIFNYLVLMNRFSYLTENRFKETHINNAFTWFKTSLDGSTPNYNDMNEYKSNNGNLHLNYKNAFASLHADFLGRHVSFTTTGTEAVKFSNFSFYNISIMYTMPFFGEFNNIISTRAYKIWQIKKKNKKIPVFITLNWLGVVFEQSPDTKNKNTNIKVEVNDDFYNTITPHLNGYVRSFNLFDIPLFENGDSTYTMSRIISDIPEDSLALYRKLDNKMLLPIPRTLEYSLRDKTGSDNFSSYFCQFSYPSGNTPNQNTAKTAGQFYENIFQISEKNAMANNFETNNVDEVMDIYIDMRLNGDESSTRTFYFNDLDMIDRKSYPKQEYIKKTLVTYVMPFMMIMNVILSHIITKPAFDSLKETITNWMSAFNSLPECKMLDIKLIYLASSLKNTSILTFSVETQNAVEGAKSSSSTQETKNDTPLSKTEAFALFSLAYWMSLQGNVLLFNSTLEPHLKTFIEIFQFGVKLMTKRTAWTKEEQTTVIDLDVNTKDEKIQVQEKLEQTRTEEQALNWDLNDDWANWGQEDSTIYSLPNDLDD